jgi:hypothetical protein
MTPLIVVLAFVLGFAINAGQLVLKIKFPGTNQGIGQVFSDPSFYVTYGGIAVLGLVSQLITGILTTRTRSRSIEKLVARLKEAESQGGLGFDNFVDSIAERMQGLGFPRAVIIDNFGNLDYTTKRAIDRYFAEYSEHATGSELWVVFENQSHERLSSLVLDNPRASGYSRTRLFEQEVLTQKEKLDLVRLLGRPEDAVEYATVKRVCHAARNDDDQVKFFLDDRERHPRQDAIYGALDFLYLLSLTADNISLSQRFLLKHLPVQNVLRSTPLHQFLRGTNLRPQELRDKFAEVRRRFGAMLVTKEDGDLTTLQAVPEVTNVLREMEDQLGLPDARLGHLFWSLFWYDDRRNQPVEAFWVRKLTGHLLAASASEIGDEPYTEVLDRLFDAFLFAIDGCMTACWFSEIRRLLQEACLLLQDDALQKLDKYQNRLSRLLRKTWQAYSVLGEPELLTLILDIHELARYESLPSEWPDSQRLEPLFFESVPMSPEKRTRIKPDFFAKAYGGPVGGKPISDYARARAAWLALAIEPRVMTTGSDFCGFMVAAGEARSSVDEIGRGAFDRLYPSSVSEESVRLTDVMTLSTSVWCAALRLTAFDPRRLPAAVAGVLRAAYSSGAASWPPGVAQSAESVARSAPGAARPPSSFAQSEPAAASSLAPAASMEATGTIAQPDQAAEPESDEEPDIASDPMSYLTSVLRSEFGSLLDLAEDAVLLASEVQGASGEAARQAGVDYLMNGMAKELCAISLASVLIAHHYLAKLGLSPVDATMAAQINDGIILLVNDAIDYDLPTVQSAADLSSPRLIDEVDSLMSLCAVIWGKFELSDLADFMNIRRIHFRAAFPSPAAGSDDLGSYNSLVQSLGAAINEINFTGIMANLAITETLESSRELAAYYLIRAAEIAISGDFGESLKTQLALIAVDTGHIYQVRLGPYVDLLIAEPGGAPSLLYRFLKSLDENELESKMLVFLNASKQAGKAEAEKTLEILTAVAEPVQSGRVKQEIEALLDLYATQEKIKRGEAINVPDLLQAWTARKGMWKYASILRVLLENGYSSAEIRQAAASELERDPTADSFNSYLLLSLTLAQQSASAAARLKQETAGNGPSAGQTTTAVNYLKGALSNWEKDSTAETNVNVNRVLYQLDPQNADRYTHQIQKWEAIRIERDHLKYLPLLVKQGQFFVLFRYYLESMEFWGLPTDAPSTQFAAGRAITPEQRRKAASDWKASGSIIPAPLVVAQGRPCVSWEFYAAGSYMFDAPNDQDPSYDTERKALNASAQAAIPRLLELIIELPRLPASIRDLMRSHSQRLLSFTAPRE